jgi:uncharacterized protein (TIGR02001 family)
MMKKLAYALTLAGLVSVPAMAADAPASPHSVAFNVAVTSDYVFRGVSQSQGNPAVSGGADYSNTNGLYAGAWLSTQNWVGDGGYKTDSELELDLYGGYKGTVGDIGYDVGLITYYYPGDQIATSTDPDTTEVYVGATWKMLSLKYSYTVSDRFVGWSTSTGGKTNGSYYIDLTGTHDLGNGWGLVGHIGYQSVKGNDPASYTDYKVGVTKDVGFGVVSAAYTTTDADTAAYTWAGEKVADGIFALSFSKSF